MQGREVVTFARTFSDRTLILNIGMEKVATP